MCEVTTDALRALVERAREDDEFPGYFLYCQVGISGVRSEYGWVDSDGFLRMRFDLELEYEYELNAMGWDAGADGDLGSEMREIDPVGFGEGVDTYIARLEEQGVLIPLYYAD